MKANCACTLSEIKSEIALNSWVSLGSHKPQNEYLNLKPDFDKGSKQLTVKVRTQPTIECIWVLAGGQKLPHNYCQTKRRGHEAYEL